MENLKQFITDDKGAIISIHPTTFDVAEVMCWISDHDQLYEDFRAHFGYTYDEASEEVSNTPELSDAVDWISAHEQAWKDFKRYFNVIEEGDVIDDESELPEKVMFEATSFNIAPWQLNDDFKLSEIIGDALVKHYGCRYLGYTFDVIRDAHQQPVLFICDNIMWDTTIDDNDYNEVQESTYEVTYEDDKGERHNVLMTVPILGDANDEEVAFANAILELAKTGNAAKIIYLDAVYDEEEDF